MSHVSSGNHCRSDPVQVQSTALLLTFYQGPVKQRNAWVLTGAARHTVALIALESSCDLILHARPETGKASIAQLVRA